VRNRNLPLFLTNVRDELLCPTIPSSSFTITSLTTETRTCFIADRYCTDYQQRWMSVGKTLENFPEGVPCTH
jgi:hypothetical protein